MTELQQKLEQLETERRTEYNRLTTEIDALRAQLRKEGCDHSKTIPYEWEHDNGYGRQTMIQGRRCAYCLFIDSWGYGRFSDPAEFR